MIDERAAIEQKIEADRVTANGLLQILQACAGQGQQ
jgi:hypothetical protein